MPSPLPLIAAFVLLFSASIAAAQNERPLLIEGTETIYQRVLTRPGAPLHEDRTGDATERLPAFQPLYVFERDGEWLRVGPSPSRATRGWVRGDTVVEWRQNIVGAFTPASSRERQLLFRSEDELRALMNHEALQERQKALLAQADAEDGAAEAGVISVEPPEFVNIQEKLYLMPILDFVEELHPLNFEDTLLMKVASVPLDGGSSDLPNLDVDDFDAGVVIVLDTTQSMEPYIESTQRALENIVAETIGTDVGERINFGVFAFRDNPEAVPGLEYRTKELVPLARREDQSPVIDAIEEATRVATVNSPGFNEDSLAGVEDAVENTDWDQNGQNPFDGRYVVLVTDAGPKNPGDPNARSDIGPAEIQADAEGKGVVVLTLHLKTPNGGEANHAYAEDEYRKLSKFGQRTYYYAIDDGAEEAFASEVSNLVLALTDHVRRARDETTLLTDAETGEDLVDLGLAMRLAYLGRQQGTIAPDVIEGWLSSKAVEDPRATAIEPRLLVTKNEMATMAELLENLLRIGETTRGQTNATTFFDQVQEVLATMAQDPNKLVNPSAETLGGALEYLEFLPYRSQLLTITRTRWEENAILRRTILDGMRQKLTQYRKWLFDSTIWTPLYDDAPDGEYVFAMPFDVLP